MSFETKVYRPSVAVGLFLAVVLFLTAGVLVWVGAILGPKDKAAMDGFTRILFTFFPIWLFSWLAAAVFAIFGFIVARRCFRNEPTLIISTDGLQLGENVFGWTQVVSMQLSPNKDLLVLQFSEPPTGTDVPSWRPKWLGGKQKQDSNEFALSSFDLGADPEEVLKELESRLAAIPKSGDVPAHVAKKQA